MFVTALTGRASILIRPPDISSTMFFQSRNCSWKMSLPAQPDWIFHVTASARATWLGAPTPPPLAAVVAVAAPPLGAFCDRHAVTNAPSPESERYFRNPRRFSAGMSKDTPPFVLSHLVIAGAGPRTLVRIRAHSMPVFLPCQDRLFVWRYASVAVPTERICGRYSATSDQDLPSSALAQRSPVVLPK